MFVIGTNAPEQLNRFFQITNILDNPQDLLKLTDTMEMLELNNANQTTVTSNGAFNLNHHQQIINIQQSQQAQQIQVNSQMSPEHLYRNHAQQQQQPQQHQHGLKYTNNPRVSKHRELPVDVPDSFVGIEKKSPRYPPPKPYRQVSPSMPMNNLTTFNHAPSTMPYNPTSINANQQSIAPSITPNTAANIIDHNSSLRSSIKLQQLEKSRNNQHGNYPVGQMQPAINQAFELDEDDAVSPAATNQPRHSNTNNNHIQKQQQAINNHAKQAVEMRQSMPDLCSIYNRLQRNLNGELADASGDAKLVKLLSIYNTIVQTHNKQFRIPSLTSKHAATINAQGIQEPVTYKVSDLLQSVLFLLRDDEMTNDAAELLSILCKHEVDGVCSAFDRIAQSFEFVNATNPPLSQQNDTHMVPAPENEVPLHHQQSYMHPSHKLSPNGHQIHSGHHMDEYEYAQDHVQMDIENNLYQNSLQHLTDIDLSGTCTKTVRIEKSSEQPLGATIKNDDGRVIIGRIVCGGAAHKSGLLHEEDEILEVNGIQMRGKNVNEVVDILDGMNGTLTFTVVTKNYNKPPADHEKVFVRAFFSYSANNDEFLPCKELGLSFEKGEILAIIDRSDPKWWQAHREGDSEWLLAGLIPSLPYLKQREKGANAHDEMMITAYSKQEKKNNIVSMLFNCPKGSSPRRRKKSPNMPFGPDEIPYYEEVFLYYPSKSEKRPIILVGPKMIGQREIVAKLLQDPIRFASAISHTSKPMQEHERNGVDFHFVTKSKFEEDIKLGKFIECGQYQNQYYGTSLEAMKEVVKSKKTCIHLVNTTSIFNFRQGRAGAELKPFFVFVKPDDSHPEKLRNIVSTFSQSKSNIEENIRAIISEVQMIEAHYLPYFDLVITVSDVERAYQELLLEIDRIETEPQWIPLFWKELPPN